MKTKSLTLLALALLGTLLLTGCANSEPAENTGTTPVAATTTTAPPDEPPLEIPEFEYRPDLIWSCSEFTYDGDAYNAYRGTLEIRFMADHPEYDGDARFAIFFRYKSSLDNQCDWDALVEYLADLGIEEVGKEGGFRVPIFAVTIEQIKSLDCETLQNVMGLSEDVKTHGLDVMISSNKDEGNSRFYLPMTLWTEAADADTYRSDLLWHESFIWTKPIPEDDMMPPEGELYPRFSMFAETPANEDERYAVHFKWYGSADGDTAALTAYLADLGIEEVGEAGGYEFPVYAVTRAELESLDCVAMQETLGVSTKHGIDVHITSNDREHPCTSVNTCE